MYRYYAANEKIDLKCYPNYSFVTGDVNGDGKKEFIALNQTGNLLSVYNLDGEAIFEHTLENNGNWGTAIICAADINDDGLDEIIVPNGDKIAAFDGTGKMINSYETGSQEKDHYGICVPLIGAAKIFDGDGLSIIAALAGGEVIALDNNFKLIWKTDGFRRNFEHEIFFADVDGDGFDEIAFCTLGQIMDGINNDDASVGELVLLDHDGTVIFRRTVSDFVSDSHFDDISIADFMGRGDVQILVEKGLLLDLNGNIIWDISDQFAHGQWIAHTPDPNGKGKLVFISELWGNAMKSMLFTGDGKKIKDISGMPWPVFDTEEQKTLGAIPLPTRCHAVKWGTDSAPEFFLTQQACTPGPHDCHDTFSFELKALFIDACGNLLGELPFADSQIKGYFYNGEVHSHVADVDGDGEMEIVFPKQDGHVMIIKKKID